MKRIPRLDKYILWFDVSMHDRRGLSMEVSQSREALTENHHDFVVRDDSLAMLIYEISKENVFQD
jgi:hypothetical protein